MGFDVEITRDFLLGEDIVGVSNDRESFACDCSLNQRIFIDLLEDFVCGVGDGRGEGSGTASAVQVSRYFRQTAWSLSLIVHVFATIDEVIEGGVVTRDSSRCQAYARLLFRFQLVQLSLFQVSVSFWEDFVIL